MIQYKIKEYLHSRGIVFPHAWLLKNAEFTSTKATKYLSGKQKFINREDLSFLCGVLNCTPNDLMYWEDTPRMKLPPTHPCHTQLSVPPKNADWKKLLRNVDPNLATEVYNMLVTERDGGQNKKEAE